MISVAFIKGLGIGMLIVKALEHFFFEVILGGKVSEKCRSFFTSRCGRKKLVLAVDCMKHDIKTEENLQIKEFLTLQVFIPSKSKGFHRSLRLSGKIRLVFSNGKSIAEWQSFVKKGGKRIDSPISYIEPCKSVTGIANSASIARFMFDPNDIVNKSMLVGDIDFIKDIQVEVINRNGKRKWVSSCDNKEQRVANIRKELREICAGSYEIIQIINRHPETKKAIKQLATTY